VGEEEREERVEYCLLEEDPGVKTVERGRRRRRRRRRSRRGLIRRTG